MRPTNRVDGAHAGGGHRLVGALAAVALGEAVAEHRLAGTGGPLGVHGQVDVGAAEHDHRSIGPSERERYLRDSRLPGGVPPGEAHAPGRAAGRRRARRRPARRCCPASPPARGWPNWAEEPVDRFERGRIGFVVLPAGPGDVPAVEDQLVERDEPRPRRRAGRCHRPASCPSRRRGRARPRPGRPGRSGCGAASRCRGGWRPLTVPARWRRPSALVAAPVNASDSPPTWSSRSPSV